MPTYAYTCTSCGHAFDAVQSFSEDALTVCPECGGALRKQYGSIGVTFNGSGFYRTDSRSGSGGKPSSSASSKSETSTSAKPAPAAAPASS
ncbi:FmdB family transcriptional regulator [Microbacterium sp. YMB-B2]|uniref:FmdB family transcriptional regulator n=1 Tax=Microbacterium tenebrionis TaxID=2830665 RepID=A0A9X1LQH0_9MICO|nr:FmdB family zinc ribbon protein [Microbacterium tenebrionis]MCC2030010.1 FmdB family transcriptional regulator [Microbacterium tenebrionis]